MSDSAGVHRRTEIEVNRDGRILIPVQVRRDLGLTPGSTLLLSVENGRMVMESRGQLISRMHREIAESWQGDPQLSAADELIAERRAEAGEVREGAVGADPEQRIATAEAARSNE